MFNTGLNFKLYLIVRLLWVKELCLHLPQSLNGWITENSESTRQHRPEPPSIITEILFMALNESDLSTVSIVRNILLV